MASRNLKMLIIDDANVTLTLAVPHLDVMAIGQPTDSAINQLSTWEQHIWILNSGEGFDEFDILLVDCNFEHDGTAPPYVYGADRSSKPDPSSKLNPYGLIHALPLIGRAGHTKMPFVWGIHTGNPNALAKDPVAVFAYGLLDATANPNSIDILFEEAAEKGFEGPDLHKHYSSKLENSPEIKGKTEFALKQVERYREAFRLACDNTRISLDGTLDELIKTANGAAEGDEASLGELDAGAIKVKANGVEPLFINIRSFYADLQPWRPETIKADVVPYLKELAKIRDARLNIYNDVMWCLKFLEANVTDEVDKDPTASDADDEPRRLGCARRRQLKLGEDLKASVAIAERFRRKSEHRPSVAVGLILCTWLKMIYRSGPRGMQPTAVSVLGDLGYPSVGKPNYIWANRQLSGLEGLPPIGEFLKEIAKPSAKSLLDASLRDCGSRYAHDVLKWDVGRMPLPPCIA